MNVGEIYKQYDPGLTGGIDASAARKFCAEAGVRLSHDFRKEYMNPSSVFADTGEGWLYDVCTDVGVATFRGREVVRLEDIRNNDVGLMQRVPQRLALATARTHYGFVHDLYARGGSHGLDNDDGQWLRMCPTHLTVAWGTLGKPSAMHLMVPIDLQERAVNAAAAFPDAKVAVHVTVHSVRPRAWYACSGPIVTIGYARSSLPEVNVSVRQDLTASRVEAIGVESSLAFGVHRLHYTNLFTALASGADVNGDGPCPACGPTRGTRLTAAELGGVGCWRCGWRGAKA